MCDEQGCKICARIKRKIRTPDVEVDGYNLREEVLRWQDLPVPNPFDNDHYLPANEARVYIDTKGVSLEALKQFIPTSKGDSEEQKAVRYSKTLDKGHSFAASKLRATVPCDSCGAVRCIFSDNDVDTKKGPSTIIFERLVRNLENGYICGNPINEDGGLFVKRQIRCGDFIESQYYNPSSGVKGGRIVTKDICAICYETEEIVQIDEIRKKRDVGGKNPLLICRHCFNKNFEIPCSGGRVNVKQKEAQAKTTKRKCLDKHTESGRRKGRKQG